MSQSQSILRWIVLDDDDPSITYGPGWSRDENDFANQGSSGPVYKGSQHVTTQSGSLTFRFNGTRVRLMGTSNVDRSSGTPDPQWECFVDGQSIGFEQAFETHQNNWPLCITPGSLDDGEHTLTLNVTTSRGQPFYLDQVRILPSPDLERQLPNPSVIVEQSDTAVIFSNEEDWPSLNSSIRSTSADGAGLSMDFTGTKLSFVGWRLQGDYAESSARFSIDDAPPKPFPIPPVPSGSGSQFFHTFFETPTLPPGSHNLQVTYEGKGRNPAPLALDFLLIENGDIVGPGNGTETPVDEPQPSNAAASPSATSTPGKTPLGAIIGGAVGGAALIALFVAVLLLIRRRMRSNRKLPSFASFAQFSHRSPEPRYPRQSFSEAMVRKSSISRSTTASIISVPNLNYNSTYSNSGHSRKASSYMESDVELSQQSLIPATKLTPLRRNMVQGGSIPE